MKPTTLFAFLLCAGLFCFQSTNAATFYWTGATSTNWNTAANWAMSSCGGTTATSTPGSSDSAVFSGSCSNNNCTINVSINVLSLRTDNTYTGTLTQGSGNTVTIAYCKFADGTFSGSSAAITISTLLTIEGGSFTTTSGTTTIEGNFSYTGGTFYPNNGRVVFYKTLTVSGVNSSSNINLYDVEFQAIAGNSTITLSNIYFNVADSTLLTGSNQLFINASQSTSVINASGNVKVYNTATTGGGDGFIVMNGSSNQYLVNTSSTDDEGKLPNLSIDNTSGTVYLIGDITMGGSTTLTYTAGTINSGTSTVVFYYDNTITGSMVFNNIEFQGTSSTCIVSNTITVNGNMSNTQTGYEVINTGTIDLYGSLHVSNTSSSDGGSALINFSGSANDSLVFTSGVSSNEGYLPNVTIAKTGGTFCLSGTISINNNWTNNYSTANINYGTATMYFNRSNLSIGGTYCTPVWNAQFASSSEWIYTLTNDSALIVKNNLTLSGSDNFYIDGYSINIYGNIIASNTGGGDLNGTTIFNLVDSQNDSIISPSGYTINECDLPSITINKTGGTLYLIGVISEYGSWTNNYSQSSINPGTSAFFYNCNGGSIGGTYRTPVWNAEFGGSGEYTYNISADSALIVTNNLTIRGSQSFSINGYSLAIHGNIISSNTGGGDGGTTIFNLVGSSTDSIISPSGYTLGECTLAPININKTGGTLYLVGNITEDGNWTYNSGTVNAGTSSVEMIGTYTVTASQMSSYMTFNNLQIGGSGADITLASILNVDGRLTINGTLNTSSSNYQILAGNSWINNGTYTGNNSNVTFNGSVNDSIKGSDNTTFYSLTTNKTGTLNLSDPVTVTNTLTLISGDILSSSTNLLTLNNGSSVSGANDNSFVNGPVKKVGNSAFTFPTGAGSSYHAIGISAPSSTSDAFTAQYYNTEQTEGSSTDDSLTYVSACDYWNLTHTTGSSNVTVSLYWGTSSCDIKRLSSLRVGYWNGSEWTDMGQSANTGTTASGSVTATTASTAYGYFAISKHSPTIAVSAGTATTICYGSSLGIGGSPTATDGFSPYTYLWSPATTLSSSTASNPTASPTTTTTYTVTVNDNDNAPTATATVVVMVDPQILVNAGRDTIIYDTTATITLGGSPTALGGTSPYTYLWYPHTHLNDSTIANPIATFNTFDSLTYSIKVTDSMGCNSSSSSIDGVEDEIHYVSILDPTQSVNLCTSTICPGNSVYFTCTLGYSLAYYTSYEFAFVWSIYDQSTGTTTHTPFEIVNASNFPYPYTFTAPGYYCVNVSMYEYEGGGIWGYVAGGAECCIYVQGPPSFSGPTSGCPGENLEFTNTTNYSNATAFDWSTNDANATIIPVYPCGGGGTCPAYEVYFNSTQTGSFELCLDYTIGCYATVCQTITISNPCSFTYSLVTCKTMSFFGTSSCNLSGTTYSWNFDDPSSGSNNSSTLQNPSHTFSSYGTYTVRLTVTDPFGNICSSTQTITITDPVSITSSANPICSGTSSTLTASGGTSYTWEASTGGSSSSGTAITVSPTVTTTYTVTDENDCVATYAVTVDNCCVPSEYGIAYVNAFSSTLPTTTYITHPTGTTVIGATTVPAGQVVFNLMWTIDQNTTIENGSTIEFGQGTIIYVMPGETLTINNSTLTDCEYMWQGIYLDGPTAHLVVETSSSPRSIIEEAQIAVESNNGGIYNITNSTLKNNYIGIQCDTYNDPNESVITGSTIEGTASLDPPDNAYNSAIGMNISNVENLVVGYAGSGYANTFENMSIGLQINNSNVTAVNNTFDHINISNSNFPLTAVCINDISNPANGLGETHYPDLTVGGAATGDANTFENGVSGIVTSYVEPNIQYNTFNNLSAGVLIQQSLYRSIVINNNTMTDISYCGIQINSTNYSPYVYVNNNQISAASYGSVLYGIYINGDTWTNPNVFESSSLIQVDDNVPIIGFQNGICVDNSNYTSVVSNEVLVPTSGANIIGIKNTGSMNCFFDQNIVTAGFDVIPKSYGFVTYANATNSIYRCNEMFNCSTGMQFNNAVNNPLTVNGNWFDGGNYGVYLNNGSLIGVQGTAPDPQWNIFNENTDDLYTYNTNAGFPTVVATLNEWWSDQAGIYDISTTGTNITDQQIHIVPTTTFTINTPCPIIDIDDTTLAADTSTTDIVPFDTVTERLVVQDSLNYKYFKTQAQWMDKENLYSILTNDSADIGTAWKADSVLKRFYDTVKSTNIGLIVQLQNTIATPVDSGADSVMETELMAQQGTEASLLSLISPSNTIEQNYQTLYTIYLNDILPDSTLDSAELANLRYIAGQCPRTGGVGVYTARGILVAYYSNPFDSTYSFYYNDDSLCGLDTASLELDRITIKQTTPIHPVIPNFVTAYPNPAKDQITFVYQYSGTTDNATLDIYDVLGTKMGEYTLAASQGQYVLSLTNLSNGVYYYQMTTPCCEVGTGKFVLVK